MFSVLLIVSSQLSQEEGFILKSKKHHQMETLTNSQQVYLFSISDALTKYKEPLPIPEDAHRLLSLGDPKGIADALDSLRDIIKKCVLTYSDRLPDSGWGMVSFALVRIAAFSQLLANFHHNVTISESYINGFHANELGYVVIGALRMSALIIYSNRMVLPSIDAYAEAQRGDERRLFDSLRRLLVLELDSSQVQTQEWLEENVSPSVFIL